MSPTLEQHQNLWPVTEARISTPILIETLGDGNQDVRKKSALVLRGFGARSEVVVPALMAVVKGTNDAARCDALWALGDVGLDLYSAP